MKRLLAIAILCAVILVVLILGLGKVAGLGLVSAVERFGPELMGVPVELEEAEVSPLLRQVTLRGLKLGNPEGFDAPHAIRVQTMSARLRPATLLSDKVVIEEIVIDGPDLILETDLRSSNFGAIIKSLERYADAQREQAAPEDEQRFEIGLLRISGAQASLQSPLLKAGSIGTRLPDLKWKDLGRGEKGVTLADVLKNVLRSLSKAASESLSQSDKDVGSQLKSLGGRLLRGGEGFLKQTREADSENPSEGQ